MKLSAFLCLLVACVGLMGCSSSTTRLQPFEPVPGLLLTPPDMPETAESAEDMAEVYKRNAQKHGECIVQLNGLINSVKARQ